MMIAGASSGHFTDEAGRWLMLRGVNLGGSSKVPVTPDGRTHEREGFYDGARVSFVGRPFPLEEADEHFSHLVRWGQNFLRLLVTWEAIEHAGPGMYDSEYLEYLEAVVESAARHGVSLYIDPHQDVWSRWTGGDGAPLWTLEAVGFEARNLHASGAAMLHQEMGERYPQMQWFSNHLRLGCATMFTLFFAGDDFAPGIAVGGEPIQKFLQDRYIEAFGALARRLAAYPNVVGFGPMNEPGEGFIGIEDIRAPRNDLVLPGLAPTPWEAMCAGEGIASSAERIAVKGGSLRSTGRVQLGTPGLRAWKDGEACVWRRVGVWDIERGEAVLKRPGWFARSGSGPNDALSPQGPGFRRMFNQRYLKPFSAKFAARIGSAGGKSNRFMIFVESSALGEMPAFTDASLGVPLPETGGTAAFPVIVNETHWYDSLTLTLKRWTGFLGYDPDLKKVIVGPRALRRNFREALARIVRHSKDFMGNAPTLLGEFGLPFDLNGRRAYRTGSFRVHQRALSSYYEALDANLLNATIWDYTADNTHERGDGWNGEDLSVFCVEDGGGRALAGFVRPYAMAVAGNMLLMQFDQRHGKFIFEYAPDLSITAPTEVFVPMLQFPRGASVRASGATFSELSLKIEGKTRYSLAPTESERYFSLHLSPEKGAQRCRLTIQRL
jgi:hypothetical protein